MNLRNAKLYIKQFLLLIFLLITEVGYCQVEDFEILEKSIESSDFRVITKFRESKKFPNGKKEFKIEFDKDGKLNYIEEYEYLTGPDNPIIMRQDYKFDKAGKKVAIHIKAPDGSFAIDTFLYGNQDNLIKKQRIVNGNIVKTWQFTNDKKPKEVKEFDSKQNLVKTIDTDGNFTLYKYDSSNNIIEKVYYQDNKEHIKYTFQYNKANQLVGKKEFLLYIEDGENSPLKYYFTYQ